MGCLLVSLALGIADNLSNEVSGVTTSSRTSSMGMVRVVWSPGLSTCAVFAVPQATKDLRTATRHSKLCLLSCCSVSPRPEVSRDPGTESAVVLNDGGTALGLVFDEGCWEGFVGSVPLGGILVIGEEPNFETMLMKLRLLCYLSDREEANDGNDELFVNVISSFAVTIIIQVNLNKRLWILAKTMQHAKDDCLLLES